MEKKSYGHEWYQKIILQQGPQELATQCIKIYKIITETPENYQVMNRNIYTCTKVYGHEFLPEHM